MDKKHEEIICKNCDGVIVNKKCKQLKDEKFRNLCPNRNK